jgi:hypothetical protein
MPAALVDEVALPGYFDLSLTGLESLKFTDISGLTHSVTVNSQAVGSQTGAGADARTVGPPAPITLQMQHVVLTTMDLWRWLDETITARAGTSAKKAGTLMIKALGDGMIQATWNLDDVYLTGVTLDAVGADSPPYLTASVTLLVGSCKPMA